MPFSSLGLPDFILESLNKQNYTKPYPIQEKAIPAILKKNDVLGIAKTGSGKTASYVLPILTNLQKSPQPENRHVNVLILVPTRELAIQVKDVFQEFSPNLPNRVKTLAVYGGASINTQMQALNKVNVLVATPGRLIELVESNAVHLSSIETLVLDEADKMLDLGFKEEMDKVFTFLPKKRQNLLFSATLNENVNGIKHIILQDPIVVKIEDKKEELDTIKQFGYFIEETKKGPLLRYLIKSKNMQQVLVFTSSSYKADNVADKLRKNGIQASAIHGKKSMQARTEALKSFKEGRVQTLVATDLLGRGVDIENLPYVINYELPRSPKDYIHRIGRTGRAEKSGEAISLVNPDEEHHFKIIQKKTKVQIEIIDTEEIDLKGY